MWCFTKVMNKIYDFDEVSPTSVSKFLKSAWSLQKIALKYICKYYLELHSAINLRNWGTCFLGTFFAAIQKVN